MARAPVRAPARGEQKKGPARIPVTEASLAEALLTYLDRFDGSRKKLSQHLAKWVKRRGEPDDPVRARPLIDAVLKRYEESGLVDDKKFADRSLVRMRSRGGSARAIAFKLRAKGLGTETLDQAFERERTDTKNPELEAARALVRRRRLGQYRPEAERAGERRRDLGVLARAGFDYETSVTALGARFDEDF